MENNLKNQIGDDGQVQELFLPNEPSEYMVGKLIG